MPEKTSRIKWKALLKESFCLVAQTLLAGFFMRCAQLLNDYYRMPAGALLCLILCLSFALPLFLNLFDLLASTLASVREDGWAEKILKCSITIHNSLFGRKNAFMAQKQAILAELYNELGRTEEAKELFEESWKNFKESAIKFPPLHRSFSAYLELQDTGAGEILEEIKASLRFSRVLRSLIITGTLFIILPIIAFLLVNQSAQRDIARYNAHGRVMLALKGVSELADRESFFLGDYAASRVYADYAQAFEDTDGQNSEMFWCAKRSIEKLEKSGIKDDYLRVLLLNLEAKASLDAGQIDSARDYLKKAALLCSNWDASQLLHNKFDASFERDRCLLTLAEIDRNRGDYNEAETLFRSLLGACGEKACSSKSNCVFFDYTETVDRLHKYQHIEQKLGKKDEAIAIQKKICEIMQTCLNALNSKQKNSPLCDFSVRESARELDVCAFMMQEAGKDEEAKCFVRKADELRSLFRKDFRLDAGQQDKLVFETTRITNELLAVKYKAGDWKQSLRHLLDADLKSVSARGALERMPWFDESRQKPNSFANARQRRYLEVDISPLSIRSAREGDALNVGVQGKVKIYGAGDGEADIKKFDFAYLVKGQNRGCPVVDDLLDNQALFSLKTD